VIGGGTIIGHKYILTAAHCVDDRHVSHVNLKINAGNYNSTHLFVSEYLPRRIYIHPYYSGLLDETATPNNDIAIIQVSFKIYKKRLNRLHFDFKNQIISVAFKCFINII
jgi:secreted trypsin-like serine protease